MNDSKLPSLDGILHNKNQGSYAFSCITWSESFDFESLKSHRRYPVTDKISI